MKLILTALDQKLVRGIYTIKGMSGRMPASACFLAPDTARSWAFENFNETLVVSDILRTPESSLQAVKSGRGAKMPGFSGHNFGYSIDIDVKKSMKLTGCKTKLELDGFMGKRGWYCHRMDSKLDSESWHYNFLGSHANIRGTTSAPELENKILANYGSQLKLDNVGVQTALKKLGLYGGDLDGKLGPRSKEAIAAFCRAWNLKPSDGDKLARTLAFVAREVLLQ